MKSIFIIVTVLITSFCHGQLQFEGEISSLHKTLELENGEIKILKYNSKDKTLFIYNTDQSLWKKIILPLPKFHLLDEVKHISTGVLNNDEKLEIIYSCLEYITPDEYDDVSFEHEFIDYTLNIINEDGQILLICKGSKDFKLINTQSSRKLLIYQNYFEDNLRKTKTLIYKIK